MEDERMKRAIALVNSALEKEKESKYEEALELYKLSLENWHLVYKYQTNSMLKGKIRPYIEQYTNRAEQIKAALAKQATDAGGKKKVPAAAPADTGSNSRESSQEKQTEQEKMKDVMQSAIMVETPNVKWDDIAGLEPAKEALQEAVILPSRFPVIFTGERRPWRGILLYGPPGTGKTYLAKACATEANAAFLSVSSSDLLSKWQGESEKMVRAMFETARERQPSIVFVDEIDSVGTARSESDSDSIRRVKTEFLVQMDGVGTAGDNMLVLGATNMPWELDQGFRRRFERRVYIPLPDVRARRRLFELHLGKTPHTLHSSDIDSLARRTEGYSGADISVLVRDALLQPVRKCRQARHFKKVQVGKADLWAPCAPGDPDPSKEEKGLMDILGDQLHPPDVSALDFEVVMEAAKPSVGPEEIKKYEDWTRLFGREGN